MAGAKENGERERRIEMEIIVDAYGPEGRAMGEARAWGPLAENWASYSHIR